MDTAFWVAVGMFLGGIYLGGLIMSSAADRAYRARDEAKRQLRYWVGVKK